MKLTHKLIAGLALSSVIAFGAMAGDGKHKHRHGGSKIERMTEHLDLTQEQQVSIAALLKEYRAGMRMLPKGMSSDDVPPLPSREEMKEKMAQHKAERLAKLKDLLGASAFDESTVRDKLAERAQKHSDYKVNQMKMQHAIYQQLDSIQQDKYLAMLSKKGQRKGKRMHRKHEKKMHIAH